MTLPATSLIRKLSLFTALSDDEHKALVSLLEGPIRIDANTDLLLQGDDGALAYVVIDGWAFCYKEVENGGRQIVNFQLPGDFLGLRSLFLRTSDHAFATLTACHLVVVKWADWERVFHLFPRIQAAVLWAMAREEALVVEHLVNVGRRTAEQRTAHLLCELGQRLRGRGVIESGAYTCPIPQAMLADALGLSVVHLNRTLRKLREAGLIAMRPRGLHVPDLPGLMRHAGFDGDFLPE